MSSPAPAAIICPSLLSADFAVLGADAKRMIEAGADWLHVDVMDGHFVPNLSFGIPTVTSLRKYVPDSFLDCHLMVSKPEQWVDDFAKLGANSYTFHLEATTDAKALITRIRKDTKMKVGIAIKPKTPVEAVFPYAEMVDLVLVMTVEPGFGGQKFMGEMMDKVRTLRDKYPAVNIQVDGGIGEGNIQVCAEAGANCIVSGSGIFGAKDPSKAILAMRHAIDGKKHKL